MELKNISFNEIKPFLDSLTVEKEYLARPFEMVPKSQFICGVRVDDELAGIGGFMKSFCIFPNLWLVVDSKFQRRGAGTEVLRDITGFARRRNSFLIVSTPRENTAAVNLYRKNGFRVYYEEGAAQWMCLPFSKRGEIICRFLPLVQKIYNFVYHLPYGRFFLYILRFRRWT